MKIRPVVAEFFQADIHDGSNSNFSQFCERAWKQIFFKEL